MVDSISYQIARRQTNYLNFVHGVFSVGSECQEDVWIHGDLNEPITISAKNVDSDATLNSGARVHIFAEENVRLHPGSKIMLGAHLIVDMSPCLFLTY